jgi:Antitoxin FitA-like, ribbon-helix-helix
MARTTLDIDDRILRTLKAKAAAEGRTLQAVVNEYLKRAAARPSGPRYRLHLEGWRADPRPGVDLFDRDKLFDLMDGR